MVGRSQVTVVSGNGGKLTLTQRRDRLSERKVRIKIRVVGAAAIAGPPTRVHGELHEVCEPRLVGGPVRRAALQGAKLIQIDWIRALRSQVSVNEGEMADFILGIVVEYWFMSESST